MPELSRFYGIAIFMFYDDHSPPHIHAVYGEYRVTVETETACGPRRIPSARPRSRANMGC